MTYYKLLEKIETLHAQGATPGAPTNPIYDSMYAFENALKAVVELHISTQTTNTKSRERNRCRECGFAYPCPTIKAIEKELV